MAKVRTLISAKPPEADIPVAAHQFLSVKEFEAMNTKADRTAISEGQFSWLENVMPVGRANLRSVPNYTALGFTWATAVDSWYSFSALNNSNITTDYIIAFETNGKMEIYDIQAAGLANIPSVGQFSNTGVTFCMWNDTTPIICDPSKGLFSLAIGTTNNPTKWVAVPIGSIGFVGITVAGTGYTSAPAVTFSAPNTALADGGIQATGYSAITGAGVSSVVMTEVGAGYTTAPTITFTGGAGASAAAKCSLITFRTGTVASIFISSGGVGYTSVPTVTLTGGGYSTIATATAVLSGGTTGFVSYVILTYPGIGYTSAPVITFSASGSTTSAIATANLQLAPNSSIASFSGRIWVASGREVVITGAGSYRDFTIASSASSIILNDETLRGSIVRLFSANNFLYVFGSDSINVFSDVVVTNTGSTLFSNTVVSSSIGTLYPNGIFNYYRSVLFVNTYGIYALVGSTASKISDDLDGLFSGVDFATSVISCGQCVINNILCALFSLKYVDSTGASRYVQATFFDKKWFLTSHSTNVIRILSSSAGGLLGMYGTSGTNLVKLFSDIATSQPQTIQSALWALGDPMLTKQAIRFAIESRVGSTLYPVAVTIDSENTTVAGSTFTFAFQWINNFGATVTWQDNATATATWSGQSSYKILEGAANQYGKYLGLSITGSVPKTIYTSMQIEYVLRNNWTP